MSKMSYYDQVQEAADAIRARVPEVPAVAIVLGSGLGDFAGSLGEAVTMPYAELPHWPASRVIGHAGTLVVGKTGGKTIAALAGRCHLYEGHDAGRVAFAVRALGLLGVKMLILTNAAGGVNTGFAQGALMVIDDHINLTGHNPLVGENDERFGARFPDMTEVYARDFQEIVVGEAAEIAKERFEKGHDEKLTDFLHRGVYCALSGPTYETPSEVHVYRLLGADAVGMSTVPEAIVAQHQGMKVLGISCITNFAAGMTSEAINHEEVMETGARVAEVFKELLTRIISKMN